MVAEAEAQLLLPAPLPEPPMMPPLAMAPVDDVPIDLLLLLLPDPEPVPPQSELVVAPAPVLQEPPMVADAPLLLPAAEPEPPAAAAGAVVDEPLNLYAEPRDGSFLLEMADAIMDDGSGRQATSEDVDRLLREYGLESFKPM